MKKSPKRFGEKIKRIYHKRKPGKAVKSLREKYHEKHHAYNDVVVSWSAPEYVKQEKSIIWFVIAGIVAALLLTYGVMEGSWTFTAAIAAAVFAYAVYHRQKPGNVGITISKIGIKISNHRIPYSNMRAFWIVYHPPFIQTLNIRTADALTPDLTIQLGDQSPVEIREYLVRQIPEWEGKHENFIDSLARFLKL